MLKFLLIATLIGPEAGDRFVMDSGLTLEDCNTARERLEKLPGSEWIELQPGAVRIDAKRSGLEFSCEPEPR